MRTSSVATAILLVTLAALTCQAQQAVPRGAQSGANYGQLPLMFEANHGQADPQVKFLSRGKGYTAILTAGGMLLSFRPTEVLAGSRMDNPSAARKPQSPATALQFNLVGGNRNAVLVGEDPRPGKVNYFIGNNPAKWLTNIPTYGRVRSRNVYPGIDLVYYGNSRQLEYDLEVSPGGDAGSIQFEIKGAQRIQIDQQGDLVLATNGGTLRFKMPIVYQEFKGRPIPVNGEYILHDSTHVGFHISQYERSKPLVIDPVLVYSTYLGGSGSDEPRGIAVDSAGSVYVTGYTDSTDFPLATFGSLQTGSTHVFVAKLDTTGSNLVYADYLGGNNMDFGYAVALDGTNDVYVTGATASTDFPMVNPYQATHLGALNSFLTKISPDGASLLYSTYFGGNGSDIPSSISVDSTGNMLIAGYTSSTNLPVANAYQSTVAPNQGGMYGNYGFLTKFSPDGSSLVYSTYFGGSSNVPLNCGGTPCWPEPVSLINGMAADSAGNAYIGGYTNTYDLPVTPGAYLSSNSTQMNSIVGFVSKVSSSGNLQYSTYFYESSGLLTNVNAIAVDASGSAYVSGTALSDGTFPLTSTSICDPSVYGWACSYAFVTKFDQTGSTLLYSTFLGPNNYANPVSVQVDASNDAYVLASTSSSLMYSVNPIETYAGGNDVLLVEVDPTGTSELWATYFGGNRDDNAMALALDSSGNLYAVGSTDSTDLPITQGVFQGMLGGNTDAFVAKVAAGNAPSVSITPATLQYSALQVGSVSPPQTALLRNMGSSPLSVSGLSASGDFTETDDCAPSVQASGSCTVSVKFTPSAAGQRTGSIAISDDATGSPHIISVAGTAFTGAAGTPNPFSLVFPSVQVGAVSTAQSVSLSSTGSAALAINSIQAIGDYSQTNNCAATLPVGSSCVINVTFAPTASGTRNGILTINDDADAGSQTVLLSGTGSDFSLAASPSTSTVKSGSSATYQITVGSVGGAFTSTVSLSCGGLPATATCSLSPTSVSPGGTQGSSTLTVATAKANAQLLHPRNSRGTLIYAVWAQGILLAGIVVGRFKAPARKLYNMTLLAVIALLLMIVACAGGTGVAPQGSGSGSGTPPGSYIVTVTGTSATQQHSVTVTLTVQ